MTIVDLPGCATQPLGSYLKALAVLRLTSEQTDTQARGWWKSGFFHLQSTLDENSLIEFFLDRYQPTPILAPWNGGSGFYAKDRKVGIDAISSSDDARFDLYRNAIAIGRQQVGSGEKLRNKAEEDGRRAEILR